MLKVSYKKIGVILAAASGLVFLFNIGGAGARPTPCLPCGNAQYTIDEKGKQVRCINGCAEGTGDSADQLPITSPGGETQPDVDKLSLTDGSGCNPNTEYEHVDITGEVKCIPKGTVPENETKIDTKSKTKSGVSVDSFLRLSTLKRMFRGGPFRVALSPTGPKTIKDIVIKVLDFLITLAIPFAVLAIIWAGFMFVTAQGNEQKIGKARQNLLWTVVGVAIVLASKVLIGYIQDLIVGGGNIAASFFDQIRGTLNLVIELLFVLATVYFFWGVINYIGAAGDESKLRDGKRHMIWGIVGMVIMAGAWGLVTILAEYIQ